MVERTSSSPSFDLFDPTVQQRPFEAYTGLRARGAVHVIDPTASPLTFVVSQYESARAVLGDPQTFSSRVPSGTGDAVPRPAPITTASGAPSTAPSRPGASPPSSPAARRRRRFLATGMTANSAPQVCEVARRLAVDRHTQLPASRGT
jgi:cytochrome P450